MIKTLSEYVKAEYFRFSLKTNCYVFYKNAVVPLKDSYQNFGLVIVKDVDAGLAKLENDCVGLDRANHARNIILKQSYLLIKSFLAESCAKNLI